MARNKVVKSFYIKPENYKWLVEAAEINDRSLSVSSGYLLSSFENRNTSILIYDPIKYKANGHDEILPMDTLRQYGVPFDGMMKIDRLSGDTLILHSRETGRLCFKRY